MLQFSPRRIAVPAVLLLGTVAFAASVGTAAVAADQGVMDAKSINRLIDGTFALFGAFPAGVPQRKATADDATPKASQPAAEPTVAETEPAAPVAEPAAPEIAVVQEASTSDEVRVMPATPGPELQAQRGEQPDVKLAVRQVKTTVIRPEDLDETGAVKPADPEQARAVAAPESAAAEPEVTVAEEVLPAEPARATKAVASLDIPVPADASARPAAPAPIAPASIATAAEQPEMVRVDSATNVRATPSSTGKKLFVLAAGEQIQTFGSQKGWIHVSDGNGRNGWVHSTLIAAPARVDQAPVDTAAAAAPAVSGFADEQDQKAGWKVKAPAVTVRSGPGRSNGEVFTLFSGDEVSVAENQKGWLHVVDKMGRSGWAYKSFFAEN